MKINIYKEAFMYHLLMTGDAYLFEYDEKATSLVKDMISRDNSWEVNNYEDFLKSRSKSKYNAFFTPYTAKMLKDHNVTTYKLKGYDIGYALVPVGNGNVDIISVFNNEPEIKNIADDVISMAIHNGGNQLDHYDGVLSDIYSRNGFIESERYKWDDAYMNPDWDKEKFGEPDVIVRKLNPEVRKSLLLQRKMNRL